MSTITEQHSRCPDIVKGREERTWCFLVFAVAIFAIAIVLFVWTNVTIGRGNMALEGMKYRLNDVQRDIYNAEVACKTAITVCQSH